MATTPRPPRPPGPNRPRGPGEVPRRSPGEAQTPRPVRPLATGAGTNLRKNDVKGTGSSPGEVGKPIDGSLPARRVRPRVKPEETSEESNLSETSQTKVGQPLTLGTHEVVQFQEPSTTAAPKSAPVNLSWVDAWVIVTIWLFDAIVLLIESWRRRLLFELSEDDQEYLLYDSKQVVAPMVCTLLAMIGVSLSITYIQKVSRAKFWILFGGMAFYSATPLLGLVQLFTNSLEALAVMSWRHLFWAAVNPIRYLLIFQQKFPLPFTVTHMYTSVNIFIIGLVYYLCTVWVEGSGPLDDSIFLIFWIMSLILALTWLAMTYFIRPYLNPSPADLGTTRQTYQQTEVIGDFNARQNKSNVTMFLLILYPGAIFPALVVAFDFIYNHLVEHLVIRDTSLSAYRLDFVASLVLIVIIELIIRYVKQIRNELGDLIFIGIAHLFNVAIFGYLLYILTPVMDIQSHDYPRRGFARVMFVSDPIKLLIHIVDHGAKWVTPQHPTVFFIDLKEPRITVRLADEHGLVRIVNTLAVDEGKNNVFDVHFDDYNPVEILKIDTPTVKPHVYPNIAFITSLRNCDLNPALKLTEEEALTTRGFLVYGICIPLNYRLSTEGDYFKPFFFKPPAYGNVSEVVELPCNLSNLDSAGKCPRLKVAFYRLIEHLKNPIYSSDENMKVVQTNDVSGRLLPYHFFIIRICAALNYKGLHGDGYFHLHADLPKDAIILPMMLHGIAWGLAIVGYLHFMWIKLPVQYRLVIIFGFFLLVTIATWSVRVFLRQFMATEALYFFIATSLLCFWHIAVSTLFWRKMKQLRKKDSPELATKRRF